jgi:hypothetical protein
MDESFLKYKNHCLIHLANEARVYNSHLGGLDAYPFENFLGIFRRKLVKSGKSVLTQCYNRLQELSFHSLARDENDELQQYDIDTDRAAEIMIRNGSMFLPAHTVVSKEMNRKNKYVKCVGFTVTCTYPDNIVLLSRNDANDDCIVAVDEIFSSGDGNITMLKVFEFRNVRPAHESFWETDYSKVLPEPLSAIGCFEAKSGLRKESVFVPFSRVVGKFFPFHMNLFANCDPKKCLNDRSQWWTFVQMKHTMPAETLK